MLYGIDQQNLQQRAEPEKFMEKAVTGASDIAQMNQKMSNQQGADNVRLATLKDTIPNYSANIDLIKALMGNGLSNEQIAGMIKSGVFSLNTNQGIV